MKLADHQKSDPRWQAETCIFCQIVAGELPASVVYEDSWVMAFLDKHPLTRGHLLVIPKSHIPSLRDLDAATGARMFNAATRLAVVSSSSGLGGEAANLFLSDGKLAGQEVFHLHLHVIPRSPGDPFGAGRPLKPVSVEPPTRDELDTLAGRIRSKLVDQAREPRE